MSDNNKQKTFADHAMEWIESLPESDANKFIDGIGLSSMLVLFKYFPDNAFVKEFLQGKL